MFQEVLRLPSNDLHSQAVSLFCMIPFAAQLLRT